VSGIALVATGAFVVAPTPAGATACSLTNAVSLVSAANAKYVTASLNYTGVYVGMLRAGSAGQGSWEKFSFVDTSDGHIAIRSSANGRYVSALLNYPSTHPQYGMLRASATTIGSWEKFDSVAVGSKCALRSVANNRYVSVEMTYPWVLASELRARATTAGATELFTPIVPSNCVNPFAGNESHWGLERTDQGVDYGSHGTQPVKAVCDGTVISTSGPGWPGGVFIYYKFSSGPWKGKCSYIAEDINNLQLHAGSVVRAGQVLGYSYDQTEWGWAQGAGAPATRYAPGQSHDVPTAGGLAFARFLRSLGAHTLSDPGAGPQYAGNSCP
jgi:hypothetical protein